MKIKELLEKRKEISRAFERKMVQNRKIIYAFFFPIITIVFLYANSVVYVNSYNLMHKEQIAVFSFYETADKIEVELVGKRITLFDKAV